MKTSDGLEVGQLGGPELPYKVLRLLGEAWGARLPLIRQQAARKILKKYSRLPQGQACLRELLSSPDPGVRKLVAKKFQKEEK